MYYDAGIQDMTMTFGDAVEELLYDDTSYVETMNDWLQNMKRW